MTLEDPDAFARNLLAELEKRLAAKDLDTIADFFTDDVVLIGDGSENFDRKSTVSYLQLMVDMEPNVRWEWDHVAAVECGPGVVSVAAAGTLGFVDSSEQLLGEREPFRLTCLAVEDGGTWRLRHFHGSAPRAD